jgi:hypothetical protein
LGKILEFYERNDEALKAFEAAVKIGDSRNVKDNAYAEAVAARQRLAKK